MYSEGYYNLPKSKNMGKTYYNISRKKDTAGESEICMRIYVSKENRIRVGSGIWVEAKRWGKKNEINIPNIPGEERVYKRQGMLPHTNCRSRDAKISKSSCGAYIVSSYTGRKRDTGASK